VLLSICGVNGFRRALLTESSPPRPLTTYARANLLVERDNLPLGDGDFASTALRLATVYGLSGRMRFDLTVNAVVRGP